MKISGLWKVPFCLLKIWHSFNIYVPRLEIGTYFNIFPVPNFQQRLVGSKNGDMTYLLSIP